MQSLPEDITVAVWVHVRNRRLLTVRPHNTEVWFLPGGLPEVGETLSETAARETEEETGIKLRPGEIGELTRVRAPAWGRPGTVTLVCFTGEPVLVQQPEPLSEIAEVGWITSTDRQMCAPAIRLVVDHLLRQRIID